MMNTIFVTSWSRSEFTLKYQYIVIVIVIVIDDWYEYRRSPAKGNCIDVRLKSQNLSQRKSMTVSEENWYFETVIEELNLQW